jgi:hypothetical protein
MPSNEHPEPRECGECSLCCTVLRVDELDKLGGVTCEHVLAHGGCRIHPTRPGICRGYRCLWLRGGLELDDRPDRLGAVVDILTEGHTTRLSIQEAHAGAFDASPRLHEIVDRYRGSMPVRLVEAGNVMDPDRPFRVLLANGEEQRILGEFVEIYRDGVKIGVQRMPWFERMARKAAVLARRLRVRGLRSRR